MNLTVRVVSHVLGIPYETMIWRHLNSWQLRLWPDLFETSNHLSTSVDFSRALVSLKQSCHRLLVPHCRKMSHL